MLGSSSGWPIVLAPANDLLALSITEGIEDGLIIHMIPVAAFGLRRSRTNAEPRRQIPRVHRKRHHPRTRRPSRPTRSQALAAALYIATTSKSASKESNHETRRRQLESTRNLVNGIDAVLARDAEATVVHSPKVVDLAAARAGAEPATEAPPEVRQSSRQVRTPSWTPRQPVTALDYGAFLQKSFPPRKRCLLRGCPNRDWQ